MKTARSYVLHKMFKTKDRASLEFLFYQILSLIDEEELQELFQEEMHQEAKEIYPDPCFGCGGDILEEEVKAEEAFICPICDNIFCPDCIADNTFILDESIEHLEEYTGKRVCQECIDEVF